MALNSSGPISLAGSVTGQSIAVELSQSPFASISLNDTTVRTLAGVASGAIVMPTNFWGKSSSSAWISYKNPSGTFTNVQMGVFTYNPTNNKIYISAYESLGGTDYNNWLAEYNLNGTCNWTKFIKLSMLGSFRTENQTGPLISFDSSNNIYVYTVFLLGVRTRAGISKFNSLGNFVSACSWQSASTTLNVQGPGAFFNNNFVYSSIAIGATSTRETFLSKWDSSLNASVTSIKTSTINPITFAPIFKKFDNNDFYTTTGNRSSSPPINDARFGLALVSESSFSQTNSFLTGFTLANVSPNSDVSNGFQFAVTQNTTNGNVYIQLKTSTTAPVPNRLVYTTLNSSLSHISSYYYSYANTSAIGTTLFYNGGYLYSAFYEGSVTPTSSYILKIDVSTGNVVSNWKCSIKNAGGTVLAYPLIKILNQVPYQLYDTLFYFQLQQTSTSNKINLLLSNVDGFNSLTFVDPYNSSQFYVFEPGGLSLTQTPISLTNETNTASAVGNPWATQTQSSTTNTSVSAITLETNV